MLVKFYILLIIVLKLKFGWCECFYKYRCPLVCPNYNFFNIFHVCLWVDQVHSNFASISNFFNIFSIFFAWVQPTLFFFFISRITPFFYILLYFQNIYFASVRSTLPLFFWSFVWVKLTPKLMLHQNIIILYVLSMD